MKRSVLVLSMLCSMELFRMSNSLLDAHAMVDRTSHINDSMVIYGKLKRNVSLSDFKNVRENYQNSFLSDNPKELKGQARQEIVTNQDDKSDEELQTRSVPIDSEDSKGQRQREGNTHRLRAFSSDSCLFISKLSQQDRHNYICSNNKEHKNKILNMMEEKNSGGKLNNSASGIGGSSRKQLNKSRSDSFLRIGSEGDVSYENKFTKVMGDFTYTGDVFSGGICGKGKITHKNEIVSIEGHFFNGFLDVGQKINVVGVNRDKTYVFERSGLDINSKYWGLVSIEDIAKVTRSIPYGGSLCLRFDGGKEGIVFNSGFVYKGELVNDEITGEGSMVKNTGEILEGKFCRGIYVGKR